MDHDAATPEQKRAAYRFTQELMHLVSLMLALMVKQLRKDFDLSTVYPHDMAGKPPFMDSNVGVRGWSRWEVFVVRVLALNDLFEIHNPQQQAEVPVIGGLREEERARLMELVPTPAMKGRGATLNGTRVYAVFALINQLYIRRIKEGGLQTHAPLVARLGGIAEEGIAAFGHCYKLASTQFPFAWAQVVMAFLAIMGLLLPFVVANFVEQLWMGVVLSFVIVLTYWSLNEVASEMEDPFGFDPNDLPLARYVFDFNNGILASVYQLRPPYFDQFDAEEAAQRKQLQQAGSSPRLAFAEPGGSGGSKRGDGEFSSSGGGGGGRTRSLDGPSTPLYAPPPASPRSSSSSRPATAQSPQAVTPNRWVGGAASSATDSPSPSPPPPPAASPARPPSAAAAAPPPPPPPPLSRLGSAATCPDLTMLESAKSITAAPRVAEATAAAAAAAAAVIFATPFSRQPSGRCDSPRVSVSRKASAVLPLNS